MPLTGSYEASQQAQAWSGGQTVANDPNGSRDRVVKIGCSNSRTATSHSRCQAWKIELKNIPLFEPDSLQEIGGLALVQEIVD